MSTLAVSPSAAGSAAIPDRTYGPDDLARLLNVTRWTVLSWRRAGTIPPGVVIGRTVRWTPSDITSLLAARGE